MNKNRILNNLLATTIIGGAMSVASPAFAQTVPATPETRTQPADTNPNAPPSAAEDVQEGDTIVVTGTLIQNLNLTSSSPVQAVTDAEIIRRAPNTAEELLRSLPGVSPGVGSQVNNGSNGTNNVDLRGLGVQRNLVLLDGQRIVPSLANGAVNLNLIPVALLQRVDVLTGGASTTYGADAVSGVVNFITRRDFSGVDFRTGYKITQRGDGASFRADLTLGANFADDRGNAVISFGYSDVDPVYQIRDFSLFGVSSTSGAASGASATSVPTAIAFNNNAFLQIDANGLLSPTVVGFNFNPYNIFQTPLKRKSAYGAANYEVADGVEVYARGLFSQNSIKSIIAPSGIFGLGLTIPANNPFLTTALRNQICANQVPAIAPNSAACNNAAALALPGVYRRTVEVGPRISNYENNVYDARAGVRIDVTQSMNLDLSGSYGRSEQTQTQSGYVLNSRVQQALNANNATTCTVTTASCVPLNLFGPAGSITPAMAAFIQGGSTIQINTELSQVRALLSGDFGSTMPWAAKPISYAVGAEYRKYTYERLPDARAQDPSELGGAGGAILPFKGGFNVKEVYGELIAPIAADRPFFNELTLEAGVRHSSYNINAPGNPHFSAVTWKLGATWEMVDGFRLRGNYQRAVRAPNIAELFAPVVTGLTSLTVDPCAGAAPTTNAQLAAVCIAQGAPAGSIGSIQNPSAGQANATGGGNPNIRPEKADTFTVGAVFTPRAFIPGLTASLDYYNIKIANAITSATPGDVIAGCFTTITAASATSVACTGIRRNPVNGRLSGPSATTFGLPTPLTNNGRFATDGFDLTLNFNQKFGDMGLNLNFVGNYTRKLIFQAAPTSVSRNCVGFYSSNCGPSLGQLMPKISWQQRTTFTMGPANLSLLWRHLGAMKYEGQAADFAARGFTAGNRNLFSGTITNAGGVNSALAGRTVNFNRIPSFNYFDLVVQFDIARQYQLTLGVQNLMDKKPPIVGGQAGTTTANSGNTFPSTYDPLGRTFSASVRLAF